MNLGSTSHRKTKYTFLWVSYNLKLKERSFIISEIGVVPKAIPWTHPDSPASPYIFIWTQLDRCAWNISSLKKNYKVHSTFKKSILYEWFPNQTEMSVFDRYWKINVYFHQNRYIFILNVYEKEGRLSINLPRKICTLKPYDSADNKNSQQK